WYDSVVEGVIQPMRGSLYDGSWANVRTVPQSQEIKAKAMRLIWFSSGFRRPLYHIDTARITRAASWLYGLACSLQCEASCPVRVIFVRSARFRRSRYVRCPPIATKFRRPG